MATWEEFALENASLQTGIPHKMLAKLLHLHWTWVAPMFMWVYRPAFIRMFFLPFLFLPREGGLGAGLVSDGHGR